ncbi:MAG: DNA repair protein RecO, partial [Alphaproteobacteria bacterium]
ADKLLDMPPFMLTSTVRAASLPDIETAFRLTSFFFTRHVWEPRAQKPPEAREGFLNAIARSLRPVHAPQAGERAIHHES